MGNDRYKQYYQGGYYHIFNRGVGKQNIFLDAQDYTQYLNRLRKYKQQRKATILCYCLMPNHIHLIARQNTEQPIYKFIQSLHTSYGIYFNKKYDRVGSLWQDRFKQTNIANNPYLIYLSCYIHLNPLLDKIVENLDNYLWSSYLDYVGARNGTLCEKEIILQGQSFKDYKQLLWKSKNTVQNNKEVRHLI